MENDHRVFGLRGQSVSLHEAGTSPNLFAQTIENWSTETHPVKAHGFALITCVLKDPSSLSAAVATTELASKAGYWTYALVSRGKHDRDMQPAKEAALRHLRTVADGVIEVSHEEVLAAGRPVHQDEWELLIEGEYLGEIAALLADCVHKTSNVDSADIRNWIDEGGSVHHKRLILPPDFRNARRQPLDAYAREAARWLQAHNDADRCLVFSPMQEDDGSSLVGLAEKILGSGSEILGEGNHVVGFEPDGYHSTLELLVLTSRS